MHSETIQASDILTSEDVAFLATLANELVTQDRGYTAKPVFYQVLQDLRQVGMDPDYSDGVVFNLGEDEGEDFYPGQEFALKYTILRDFALGDDDKADLDDACDLAAIYACCERLGIIAHYTGYTDEEERDGCWLTLAGVKRHIGDNPKRYKNPRPYAAYSYDPDFKRLLEIVEKFAAGASEVSSDA